MLCPVCNSNRKPEDVKCLTCGIDFSKWLSKTINKLNKKTDKVMQNVKSKKNPETPEQVAPSRYKEIIKQD
ncbi:MAG: hypothetical protein KKD44_09170 [Proteobacteria bacterium]|nr:hypothetical protein [Pseudomonadota bacterium]